MLQPSGELSCSSINFGPQPEIFLKLKTRGGAFVVCFNFWLQQEGYNCQNRFLQVTMVILRQIIFSSWLIFGLTHNQYLIKHFVETLA